MPTATTKTFDAVEMSRGLREDTSRTLAALSREQRLRLLNAHIRKEGVKYGPELDLSEEPPNK